MIQHQICIRRLKIYRALLIALTLCFGTLLIISDPASSAPTATASSLYTPTPTPGGALVSQFPTFTSNASVSPSARIGGMAHVRASLVTDMSLDATVSVEIRSPSDIQVFEQVYDGQVFGLGERKEYSFPWPIPDSAVIGAHTVKIGVVSPDRRTLYHWNDGAAHFSVTSVSASASPTPLVIASPTPLATASPVSTQTQVPTGTAFATASPTRTSETATAVVSSVTCLRSQFRAEYYNNRTLGGGPSLTRCDDSIDYSWGSGGPGIGISVDDFSVRWTGFRYFVAGAYRFTVRADDGIRLWLDGNLLIDAWKDQGPTTYEVTQTLATGEREIRVEYYENTVDAVAQVRWQSVETPTPAPTATPRATSTPAPTATVPAPEPTATVSWSSGTTGSTGKLLFGLGPQADGALNARLTQEAPVRLLTSWYNGPDDLSWMGWWRGSLVPDAYARGYAMHLVVFSEDWEGHFGTAYGTACGRHYPLSSRFLEDMRQLAQTFAGSAGGPPLYVTLFTEFQTYACTDNAWNPNPETNAYWRALKDQYRATREIFRQYAPNARVSLGWGGWQTRFDHAPTGAGRSMFQYFADVMHASDFQSFQAMQSDSNVQDARAMVDVLNDYGPVLLAHYKPDSGSQSTFETDIHSMLTDSYLSELTAAGLFGWSFMDQANMYVSESTYQTIKGALWRNGVMSP